MTARSDRWCGCDRSCVTSRRSSSIALELGGGDALRGEVGRLVVDQVVGERIAVLGQEAPGIAGVGRVVELEAVVGDDPDDVVTDAGRVAEALQDLVGKRGADARMVVVVALVERLAEIVEKACEAHLEPVAVVGGDLGDREQVLVERQRLPVGAEREADRGRELRDHAREHARVAGEEERAGRLLPEQELRELALGVGLDPASDPLRGDVSEAGSGACIWASVSGARSKSSCETKRRRAHEAKRVVLEARRPDGAQLSPLEVGDAAERVDEAAVLEPAGHGVDREVAAGHVLLELDRGVADDREVAVPRPGRPLRARRREVDAGRDERPDARSRGCRRTPTSWPCTCMSSTRPCGSRSARRPAWSTPGHEEVLVAVRDAEQLVAHGAADDVGVDAERADVGADRGRHRLGL